MRVEVGTESAGRTIWDKEGDLPTPADRDRRLQYMVTAALLHGDLTVEVYGADTAADPVLNALRRKAPLSSEVNASEPTWIPTDGLSQTPSPSPSKTAVAAAQWGCVPAGTSQT